MQDSPKDLLITRVLRETLKQQLVWRIKSPPSALTDTTESVIPLYFETQFKGERIGLYESRFKHYTDYDEYHWSGTIGFCIIKTPALVVWQVEENSPALSNLFALVREQVSGIQDLLAR